MDFKLHRHFVLTAFMVGIIFGFVALAWLPFKLKKQNHSGSIKCYVFMLLCLLVMVASWLLNVGWFRVLLTFLAFPVIHAMVFGITNGKAILQLHNSPKLARYTWIAQATYLLFYMFFPDGGDVGPMYVFFGLIRNNTAAEILGMFSGVSLATHTVVTVLQLIEMHRIKKAAQEKF